MACGPKMDKNMCPQCGGSKPNCGCGGNEGKSCNNESEGKKKKCGKKMK